MAMIQQGGNVNKEIETLKKNEMEILKLKNTINMMKNSRDGLSNSTEMAEERISELDDKSQHITARFNVENREKNY